MKVLNRLTLARVAGPLQVHSCIQHNRTYGDLAGLLVTTSTSSTLWENDVLPDDMPSAEATMTMPGNVASSASRPSDIIIFRGSNALVPSILFLVVIAITWL